MKAPAYQMYAAEWLADELVMLMSLEAEGAYIRLLNYCWREGSIPADPKLLSRMAKNATLETITEVLPCFHEDPNNPFRLLHKRLELEREKQEAYRAKQSAKGMKGGRPNKATVKPEESHGKAVASFEESQMKATVKPQKSSSSSSSSSESTYVDGPSPEALKAETIKRRAALTTDPEDEQHWSAGPLTKPGPFKVIAERLGFLEIDFEHYRKQALVAAEDANTSRTINQWTSWIRNFFNNQQKHGPLLKVSSIDLSKPTPRNQYPAVGKEFAGQVFVLENTGDDVMNRHKIAATLKYYPTAAIHFTQVR